MRYVLDSSVAFKWVVPEVDSPRAVRLRDEYRNGVHNLIAPDVFPFELAHALTRAERQARLNPGEALVLWTDVMTTPPVFFPGLPLTQRAIEISSLARTGIYDCLYIALTEREQCEFVTADTRLVANLGARFPFVKLLATLP